MHPHDTTRVRAAAGDAADPDRTRVRGVAAVDPGSGPPARDFDRDFDRDLDRDIGRDRDRTVVRPPVRAASASPADPEATTEPLHTRPAAPALPPPPEPRMRALPAGARLHQDRIESVLGQGGSGITYLATDVHLSARVAIKEFLPEGIVCRGADGHVRPNASAHVRRHADGLRSFLAEARTLAAFRHPVIVRVARFFEARGTAHMVLEDEEGQPLRTWWPGHRQLGEARLVELLLPLMEGLAAVHEAGFLHRDKRRLRPAGRMGTAALQVQVRLSVPVPARLRPAPCPACRPPRARPAGIPPARGRR